MTNKAKTQTNARKVDQVAKVVAKQVDVPIVRTTLDAQVHLAPLGTRTIVDVARELNLTPKNARRILRSMKAQSSIPDYDHSKGDRHYLTDVQIDAYKARVMRARS